MTWVPIHQFFAVDQVVKSSNHSQGAQGLGKDSWGSKSLGCRPLVKNAKVLETKHFPPYSSCLFLGVQREYSIQECLDMDIAASVLLLEPCVLQITIVQEPNVAHDQDQHLLVTGPNKIPAIFLRLQLQSSAQPLFADALAWTSSFGHKAPHLWLSLEHD